MTAFLTAALAAAGAISTLAAAGNWLVKLIAACRAPNAEQNRRLEQLEILALDYNTLEEVIYAYAENHNEAIKEAEALITEYLALEDEINAKDAELEAAMTALITAEQYENFEAIEALKETVAFYEGLLVALKTDLTTLESGSSSTIIFESLARAINTTKDNIERIHAIIDQIEAEMNALLTTEE